MSGGHFCDYGYIYYRVEQFADELKDETANEENGCIKPETLIMLKTYVYRLTEMANAMRHIDLFYSGDINEDSLVKNINASQDNNVSLVNSAFALIRLARSLRKLNKTSITTNEIELIARKIYKHACLGIQKA